MFKNMGGYKEEVFGIKITGFGVGSQMNLSDILFQRHVRGETLEKRFQYHVKMKVAKCDAKVKSWQKQRQKTSIICLG